MPDQLDALRASDTRLNAIIEGFDADQLRLSAYPTEWSVADVLSHLGSAAVIMQTRLDAVLAGTELADDYAQPIWDVWNAKTPDAQVADALVAGRALLERFESLTDDEKSRVQYPVGPMTVALPRLIIMRLAEHALHTWDVEVVLDPNATLPSDAAGFAVENVAMIAQYTAQPTGTEREVLIHTTDPSLDLTLSLGTDAVSLAPTAAPAIPNRVVADLELPTEAFVRLVYGRLDPAHTPPVRGDVDLDELRQVFPGV